jgi:hypothetical protein
MSSALFSLVSLLYAKYLPCCEGGVENLHIGDMHHFSENYSLFTSKYILPHLLFQSQGFADGNICQSKQMRASNVWQHV